MFFEATSDEIWNTEELCYYPDRYTTICEGDDLPTLTDPTNRNCQPYIKATIVDEDGSVGPVEVDIDFTGSTFGYRTWYNKS